MTPSYDDVMRFLDQVGAELTWWQRAWVASIAGAHGERPTFGTTTARGWGKKTAERWAMRASHQLAQHVHFVGPDQRICTNPEPRCLELGYVAYDPEEMNP